MKKLFSTLFVLMLVFSILGCGTTEEADPAEMPEELEGEVYEIILSHAYSMAAVHHEHMEWFKRELEDRSDGQIKVTIHSDASLMPIDQEIVAILDGRITASLGVASSAAAFEPLYYIFDMPFLFEDEDHLFEFVSTEEFNEVVVTAFDERGIKLWPVPTDSAACFSTAAEPVYSYEDMQGKYMRILGGRYAEATGSALGYSAITISGAELPSALMQGTVDGAVTYPIYINSVELPVAYISLVPLNYQAVCPLMLSKDFFESLPEDLQEIVDEVAIELVEHSFSVVEERYDTALEEMRDRGIEINELPQEDLEKIAEDSKEVWDLFIEDVEGGEALINKALELN